MKKFTFGMQKVLDYSGSVKDNELNALGTMRQKCVVLYAQLDVLTGKYAALKAGFAQMCEDGAPAADMRAQASYISGVQAKINRQNELIAKAEEEIALQLQKVLAASKEKAKLDKLKDKHLEIYRSAELKESEKFIDEFVANTCAERG